MKLQIRVFFALLLTLGIIFYFFIDFIKNDLGIRYVESVEESLIDVATILASYIETKTNNDKIETKYLKEIFDRSFKKRFEARIYNITKKKIDLNIYVVNAKGIVIYDSNNGNEVGKDYSKWNDIYLALQDKYGARISKTWYSKEALFVASPIKFNNKIIGAVTVVKPKDNIERFKDVARKRIVFALILAFFIFVILIITMTYWITKPITRLIKYVRSFKTNKRIKLPDLSNTEIKELGLAFEEIFEELEGKKYIENYIQTLTHEIKSPLSSIRGASELLEENLPEDKKIKFYENIKNESIRIENLITRLLELSAVESRKELKDVTLINLYNLLEETIKSFYSQIEKKQLTIINKIKQSLSIYGEEFLIKHCFSNILENSIKFSFSKKKIEIKSENDKDNIVINIIDEGSGIPDYAVDKIFDKFYSLPTIGDKKKSTGLGLSFVKEVVELHEGKIEINNNKNSGITVKVSFPVKK